MYDSLIESAQLAAAVILGLGLLYLVAGLTSPGLARAPGRGTVVLRAGLAVVLAASIFIGVIAYTHSQPDGPHAIDTYLKDYNPQQSPAAPAGERNDR